MIRPQFDNFYEQVGTPLVPADMSLEEPNIEDLTIPTRAELEARQAREAKGDDSKADGASGSDDAGDDGKGGQGAGKDGEGRPAEGEAEADGESVLAGDTGEVYQATLEDPGDFKPGEHSFEVTVYDEDGKNGKTVKVKSVEDFEQLLDEDKNFGTAAALLKAQRMALKMETAQEREKLDYEAKKKAFTEQSKAVASQNEALNKMAAELTYLVGKGKLPPVAKKYMNADWADPEVAKQPGVKEQLELLNYMKTENVARRKAGISDLSPTTALSEMRAEAAEKASKENEDKAGEARRQASARVAGTTPAPVGAAPKGVSVGRSFGSLDNLSNMLP